MHFGDKVLSSDTRTMIELTIPYPGTIMTDLADVSLSTTSSADISVTVP